MEPGGWGGNKVNYFCGLKEGFIRGLGCFFPMEFNPSLTHAHFYSVYSGHVQWKPVNTLHVGLEWEAKKICSRLLTM